jgi:steroid delta-isomerase-like uncharacterized protein
MAVSAAVRKERERIVREHMESENEHDYETTMGTFHHPRYELIATGEVHDGDAEVREYFRVTRTAFPDQRNELLGLHHTGEGVWVEFKLKGTHTGPLRGFPPTGRSFEAQMAAFFVFDDVAIVCERVYFDQLTIMRQLGIAHDPATLRGRLATVANHPVTIGRALVRSLR